jgi:hypothetical protein
VEERAGCRGAERTFGGNGNIHDCDSGYTDVYICQALHLIIDKLYFSEIDFKIKNVDAIQPGIL